MYYGVVIYGERDMNKKPKAKVTNVERTEEHQAKGIGKYTVVIPVNPLTERVRELERK